MRRSFIHCGLGVVLIVATSVGLRAMRRQRLPDVGTPALASRPARLQPEQVGAVIPPNIAPLGFVIQEPGRQYRVRIRSIHGRPIDIASDTGRITIPLGPWRALLGANRGQPLWTDIWVCSPQGTWTRFEPVTNTIGREEIDRYVTYRLLKPIYNLYKHLGIYQRDVESFEETRVLSNRSFQGCLNCHTFWNHRPDRLLVHIRRQPGPGMVLAVDGRVRVVDTRTAFNPGPAAYSAWHPSGRQVAFSVNRLSLFFHTTGETRDVFDQASDLALYDVESNTVTTTPAISRPDRLETFPAWSPDGRFLYFCAADPQPLGRYDQIRYDLMRIGYDVHTGRWGEPQVVLAAQATGRSLTEPRVSPDGRWLLFCMSDYGSFPVYQPSSDLWLMDLQSGRHWPLACNSPRCESWHAWSSNSRWIAFASKRRDGLFARIYFSYIDEQGQAHPPVLLPQADPAFYDSCLTTYNAPELLSEPIGVAETELVEAIRAPAAMLQAHLDPGVRRPAATGPSGERPPAEGAWRPEF